MMPLLYANAGEEAIVQRIGGSPSVKKHLENLGFLPGCPVCVISAMGDNLIVRVKESRIAVNRETAQKIMIV